MVSPKIWLNLNKNYSCFIIVGIIVRLTMEINKKEIKSKVNNKKEYLRKFITVAMTISLLSPIILPTVAIAASPPAADSTSEVLTEQKNKKSDNSNKQEIISDEPSQENAVSESPEETTIDSTSENPPEEAESQSENTSETIDSAEVKTETNAKIKAASEQPAPEKKSMIEPVYDTILSDKKVHYDAIVIAGRHDLYTKPGFTEGTTQLGKSEPYLNQKIQIIQEAVTDRATWIQFSINGQVIGWMNKIGAEIQYDTVTAAAKTSYEVIVSQGHHDIYTLPGYTKGNEIITKSSTYLNKSLQVLEEKKTNRATWVLIAQNGSEIGWMNKNGVTIQTTEITSSKKTHLDAIVNNENKQIFSAPGYTNNAEVVAQSSSYSGKKVQITEQKQTAVGTTWFLIVQNGKTIGWIEKDGVTIQYDTIIETRNVHYDAVVSQGRHDVYSAPGYSPDNEILTKSSSYLNKKVQIIKEVETDRATWVQISVDGIAVWMNKIGLTIKYDTVLSTKAVDYYALVLHDRHDIYTVPGYTKGNQLTGKSAAYLNQEVKVIQEKVTNRATWAQIEVNGKTVGWMNKVGLKPIEDTILSSQSVHYEAVLSSAKATIFTAPGYTKNAKVTGDTSKYVNQKVKITEQKVTNRTTWFLVSLMNGTSLGWIDKNNLTLQYDKVTESRAVHYDATVAEGRHDIYTIPGYTEGNQLITKSANYLNKKIRIVQEKVTDRAIWTQISLNGKVIGWMNKKGLTVHYDTILSTKTVDIDAKVVQGQHDIYTVPGYTKDNRVIDRSSTFLNQEVKIVQEKVAKNRATWALITINGKTIGWMNKNGLEILKINYSDIVTSSRLVHYDATVSKSNQPIYSATGFTSGADEVGKTTDYLNKLVRVTQEKVTDRAIWMEISIDGKAIGWIDKADLTLQYDAILSSKMIHYDAIITAGHHDVYSVPGYTQNNEILTKSAPYVNEKVQIIEEKITNRATWLRFSVNGKVIGWMNKNGVALQPDKINSTNSVHFDAVITAGHHDVYTVPGYTMGNQLIAKSSAYMNKTIQVLKLAQTNRATFAQFAVDGKTIGWMNTNGINFKYDAVTSTKTTNYNAKVIQGQHDVYTAPGYTQGNTIIGKSSSYLNQSVKVLQEKVTNRATWALIAVNGKTIGWMNKKGLDSMLVYLDPGHGGDEPGAISGGIKEKDLNLKVALKIEKLLVAHGYDVVMSRKTDTFVSLSNRAQEANKIKADIFVSVHHNSFVGTSYGIETYSYNRLGNSTNPMSNNTKRSLESGKLSSAVHKSLLSRSGAVDRGTRTANFHVIRETNMPAILMELGYLDNASERAKLITDSYQNKLAQGAYEGIVQYFK